MTRTVHSGRQLPLSFAQKRLWFLWQKEPDGLAYHMPFVFRLHGPLDVPALGWAVDRLVARHDALRTTFQPTDGTPAQVVTPAAAPTLRVVDVPPDDALAVARDEVRRPFDLTAGPLVRATLAAVSDHEHVLTLVLHHIVCDGWSLDILFGELAELYAARREGRPDPLPALNVQYGDYTAWQQGQLAGDQHARDLDWWRRHLDGAPTLLDLPVDHARPAVQTAKGAGHTEPLPPDLWDRVTGIARKHRTTPFVVLLAGYAALLARLGAGDDLVIGVPTAGRLRPEHERLIGFFVNVLPVRVNAGAATFGDLLRDTRTAVLSAFNHQGLAYDQLVEELRPPRTRSHDPIVQTMFTMAGAVLPAPRLDGARAEPVPLPTEAAKLDLTVGVMPGANGHQLEISYRTDLFEAPTIRRVAGQYTRLLRAAVTVPDHPLRRLPLLSDSDRATILTRWAATPSGNPPEEMVHQSFEGRALAFPDAVAVVDGDRRLTYAELDLLADGLAGRLTGLGVRPGAVVGVLLDRSADFAVAVLAVLKSGGAYLPLDPAYPAERLRFMLADTSAAVLMTVRRHAGRAGGGVPSVITLDDERPPARARGADAPACVERTAYVMYTSGSTGRPKGVAVPHRAVTRLVCGSDYVRFEPGDRVAFAANVSFDAVTFELWGALLAGATSVVGPNDVLLAPHRLAEFLAEHRVTTMFVPAPLFAHVAVARPDAFATTRCLVVGGDVCDPDAVRAVLAAGPPARLLNGYGPTETTTFALWHQIDATPGGSVPIGRPIAGDRAYLLDRELQPVPPGVPGELYLGGPGLAHGYHGRRGLTAERFVPDPYGGTPGARLYRTGDLARWRDGGVIEFLGRADQQVKVRGYRVEPGEVEAALRELPAVRAAVVATNRAGADHVLVAYVVGASGPVDPGSVRHSLADRLPDYLVPSAVVAVDELPLTPNGKLDRSRLPAPVSPAVEPGEADSLPRTPTEELIVKILADVLDVPRVGRHDDFFDLGGHSLLAARVIARLRAELDVDVPHGALFDHSTAADLAETVDAFPPPNGEGEPRVR